MSYETNPILNRIRILKGWKNSTFPLKTPDYVGHLTLWFKVYFFLKVYFWYQDIRLLTCEIRTTEFHNKILYLSLKKHIPEKKNLKSKWKTKSFLQQIQSSLTKAQNKKARFLLYRDWQTFKHKSEFFFNINKKKNFSKAWLSKPRSSSWINFSQALHLRRKAFQKEFHVFWKKKKKLTLDNRMQNQIPHYFLKEKNIMYQNSFDRINFFWKIKHRNTRQAFFKIKKQIFFFKHFLNFKTTRTYLSWQQSFNNLVPDLRQQYMTSKTNLSRMQKIYDFCLEKNREKYKKLNFNLSAKDYATTLLKKKEKIQVRNMWFFSKQQQENLQKKTFFKYAKAKSVFFIRNTVWKKTLGRNFFIFLTRYKKQLKIANFEQKFFFSEIVKNLWFHHLSSTLSMFKIRRFTPLFKQQKTHIFELLRFEQKNIFSKTKFQIKYKRKFRPWKKNPTTENIRYKLSVRSNYLNYLKQHTNLKLKYLVENLIKEYLSLNVKVKLIWPLTQFKNTKFQRLFFPYHKPSNFKIQKLPLTLNNNLKRTNKRYIYVGQNTNHLQQKNQIAKLLKKTRVLEELNQKQKGLTTCGNDNKQNFKVNVSSYSYPKLPASFRRKKKKNKYLILKRNVIRLQNEKRVWWLSKQKFISNLTTTLTLFAKYLEPQILADHLAQLVGTTKKHVTVLQLMKVALRTIHFKRGIGYRIALVGRINGTNKSRTFYLKKLKKNYARYTFVKNVNFAMSQARATIGAFCIKIWVYS